MFDINSLPAVVVQETSKPKTKQNKASFEATANRLATSILLSSLCVIGLSGFSGFNLAQNGEIGQNGIIAYREDWIYRNDMGSISST